MTVLGFEVQSRTRNEVIFTHAIEWRREIRRKDTVCLNRLLLERISSRFPRTASSFTQVSIFLSSVCERFFFTKLVCIVLSILPSPLIDRLLKEQKVQMMPTPFFDLKSKLMGKVSTPIQGSEVSNY